MELRRYLAILRRRFLLIVVTVLAGIGAGYLTSPSASVYVARARIFVGTPDLSAGGRGLVSNDLIAGLESVASTYSVMVDSRTTAQAALARTPSIQRSVEGLVAATQAAPVAGTLLLDVIVSDPDPGAAQQLANAMAEAFVESIPAFNTPATADGGLPRVPAKVFERAQLPPAPVPTDITRRLILGGLFGFALATAVALVLEYLDITIKTAADAERRLELPVLGVIPLESQQPFTPSRPVSSLAGT